MTANIRLVSSRLSQPRPLPALRSTGVPFNFSQDIEDISDVPPEPIPSSLKSAQSDVQVENPSYDAMAPRQERLIQEMAADDNSVSIGELASVNETIQAEEPSIVPLGDVVEVTPRNLTEEKVAAFYETVRKRIVNHPPKPKEVGPPGGLDTLYFERPGYFAKRYRRDLRKKLLDEHAQAMLKYKDPGVAFSVQNMFHNFALIVQGYLSGLSLGKAVFAVHFANERILLEQYRHFSLPVHVVFVIAFSIACVAACDRLGFYGFSWHGFIKTIRHSGFLGAFLWGLALLSSLLCMEFDENLSTRHEKAFFLPSDLLFWKICCVVRAVSAGAAWLLLALKPEGDELGDAIHRSVDLEMESEKSHKSARRHPSKEEEPKPEMDEAVVDVEYMMTVSYPEGCEGSPSLDRLTENGIIEFINFTGCLPQCGVCEHSLKEQHYVMYNLILSGMILPLIGFLGLIGNGLSAFVYSRPEMRCSTNIYLCCLGCSDSAVIFTGIFLFFVDSVRKFSLNLTRIFGVLSPVVYPMGMTAQTCSVYFTIFAGFDCFVQVCLPEPAKRFMNKPKVLGGCILFVILFSIVYNIPHCFEAIVIDCYHEGFGGHSWEVCPEPMRFNEVYQTVYYKYMYAVFLAVGPLIILVVLNTFIIGASIFGAGGQSAGDTISLILVVLLFIACNVAALLLNTFEAHIEELIGNKINYIVDLSNLLVVFNSSFNFVIYFTFSPSFSATLKKYFTDRPLKSECVGSGLPVLVASEKSSRSKLCKDTLGRLLSASQPEVLI